MVKGLLPTAYCNTMAASPSWPRKGMFQQQRATNTFIILNYQQASGDHFISGCYLSPWKASNSKRHRLLRRLPLCNGIRCRAINWMVKLASFNKLAKSGLPNIHHKQFLQASKDRSLAQVQSVFYKRSYVSLRTSQYKLYFTKSSANATYSENVLSSANAPSIFLLGLDNTYMQFFINLLY